MWRARRWRYLLSRIDNLPRNSAYAEAVSQDDEVAEQMQRQPGPKVDRVRVREWSLEVETLTAAVDRLGEVVQAVIAVQGGKPPKITPLPRPRTATDRLKDPQRQHSRMLSKVMIQQPDGSVRSAAELA